MQDTQELQHLHGYQRVNQGCGGMDYQDPLDYLTKIAGDELSDGRSWHDYEDCF